MCLSEPFSVACGTSPSSVESSLSGCTKSFSDLEIIASVFSKYGLSSSMNCDILINASFAPFTSGFVDSSI